MICLPCPGMHHFLQAPVSIDLLNLQSLQERRIHARLGLLSNSSQIILLPRRHFQAMWEQYSYQIELHISSSSASLSPAQTVITILLYPIQLLCGTPYHRWLQARASAKPGQTLLPMIKCGLNSRFLAIK